MRSYFGHLNTINLVIFLNNMFQVLLPMKGDHWLIVLVEKQKSSISVYHRFYFRCYSIGKNTDQIIIHRQLKSRSQNTSDGVNRAVPSAIHLLKLDQPRLCIRQANLVNALLSKRFSVQDIDYGLISRLGVMTDTGFQRSLFLYQFNYRVIAATGNDMVKQIRLNLLFLLSQRKLSLFTPGSRGHSCPNANCTHSSPYHPRQYIGNDTSHLYAGIHLHAKSDFYCLVFFHSSKSLLSE